MRLFHKHLKVPLSHFKYMSYQIVKDFYSCTHVRRGDFYFYQRNILTQYVIYSNMPWVLFYNTAVDHFYFEEWLSFNQNVFKSALFELMRWFWLEQLTIQ